MKLYATSDFHLTSKNHQRPRTAVKEKFGWPKDFPERLLETWKAQVKPEDVIVVAGDIVDEVDPKWWLHTVKRYFATVPGTLLFIPGNHDRGWRYSRLGKVLQRRLNSKQTRHFWYPLKEGYVELQALGITLATYCPEPQLGSSQAARDRHSYQLKLLLSGLKKAQANEVRPILVTHFPLREIGLEAVTQEHGRGIKHLSGRPSEASKPLLTTVCGHLHGVAIAEYRTFLEKYKKSVKAHIVSPDAANFGLVEIL